MNVAAQAFLRTVAKVVGAEVIDDAVAFFQAFEGMEEGFRERADAVAAPPVRRRHRLRAGGVAAARHDRGGDVLRRQARRGRHPACGPSSSTACTRRFGDGLAAATGARAVTLEGTDLGGLYRNLADFQLVASREEEHLAGLAEAVAPAPVVRVPFLPTDVHDLDGLTELATYML